MRGPALAAHCAAVAALRKQLLVEDGEVALDHEKLASRGYLGPDRDRERLTHLVRRVQYEAKEIHAPTAEI